jgi:hypothetical protein
MRNLNKYISLLFIKENLIHILFVLKNLSYDGIYYIIDSNIFVLGEIFSLKTPLFTMGITLDFAHMGGECLTPSECNKFFFTF